MEKQEEIERKCIKCDIVKPMSEFKVKKTTNRLCRDCRNERTRLYKRTHRKEISQYNKKYKSEIKDEIKQYNHDYSIANRKEIQKRQTKQHGERKKIDVNYKISLTLRSRLNKLFDGEKHLHTLELLGCSLDFLKIWFEFLFDENMTFENHGSYWHIDHVIPCAIFNISEDEEQQRCFHWTNLRPLEKIDNLVKNDNLTKDIIDNHEKLLKKFIKKHKKDFDEKVTLIEYNKYEYLNVHNTK
jgi:hypothetical protein